MIYQAKDKEEASRLAEEFAIKHSADTKTEVFINVVECYEGNWEIDRNKWYVADDEGLTKLESKYEFADVMEQYGPEGWVA